MRRHDREVSDLNEIIKIMDGCLCCRLGFLDDAGVYIVPLNFGYEVLGEEITLFFHSAKEGKKIELIKQSIEEKHSIKEKMLIGFEMDRDFSVIKGDTACKHGFSYKSIIGKGEMSFVEEMSEKRKGLCAIMYQNTKKRDWDFEDGAVERVCIFKLTVKTISAKAHER